MDKERLRDVLREAAECAGEVPDPYKPAAFQAAVQWLLRQNDTAPQQRSESRSKPSTENNPESINELLALFHDRSHTDRVEAIAFHALKRREVDGISTDDILAGYSAGRVPRPANIADTVAKCVRRGHLMDGDKRDGQRTWRLTATGERYISELIDELARPD